MSASDISSSDWICFAVDFLAGGFLAGGFLADAFLAGGFLAAAEGFFLLSAPALPFDLAGMFLEAGPARECYMPTMHAPRNQHNPTSDLQLVQRLCMVKSHDWQSSHVYRLIRKSSDQRQNNNMHTLTSTVPAVQHTFGGDESFLFFIIIRFLQSRLPGLASTSFLPGFCKPSQPVNHSILHKLSQQFAAV